MPRPQVARVLPKTEQRAHVIYLRRATDAGAEAMRLEHEQGRVLGLTYWVDRRADGQVRFEVQVPTREELAALRAQ